MDGRSGLKHGLLESVLYLAARDRQFRAELMFDPRSALFARLAIQIPESFDIRFIERPRGIDALVVLPRFIGVATKSYENGWKRRSSPPLSEK